MRKNNRKNNRRRNKKSVYMRKNNKKNNKKKTVNCTLYPLVSICTPSYMRKNYIKILKRCILSQDYPHSRIEWILVDDSPEEELQDVIKDVSFCKYIYNPNKMRLGEKRNFMHLFCNGDIILYMDSDDWYPPTRISHAVDMLKKNPKAIIAGTSKMYIYYTYKNQIYETGPFAKNHATAATFAFRKELLLQTKYIETKDYAEESAFLKNYSFPMVQLDPLKTILVIIHDNNTTDKDLILQNKAKFNMRDSELTIDNILNQRKFDKLCGKNSIKYDINMIKNFYIKKGQQINKFGKKKLKINKTKIISFSLWGDNKRYTHGALYNVKLAKKIYPDWKCRFYIPHPNYNSYNDVHPSYPNEKIEKKITKVPENIIEQLRDMGAEIIFKEEEGTWRSMLWRFEAIIDPDVDVIISRDCDSRLTFREKKAVDEWLKSNKGFHIMRDHTWHCTEILGGMWGIKKKVIPNLKNLIDECQGKGFYQQDQIFLKKIIYPLIKNNCIIHDEYIKYEKKNCLNFPSKRFKIQYVGEPYNENNESMISINKKIYNNDIEVEEKYQIDGIYILLNTGFKGSESWYGYETFLNKMFKDYIYIDKNPSNGDNYGSADVVFYGSRTVNRLLKENNNSKYIYLSIEPHDYTDKLCDLLIDTKYIDTYKEKFDIVYFPTKFKKENYDITINNKKKFIYFPWYSLSFLDRTHTPNDLIKNFNNKKINEIIYNKNKFCAFIYSHGSEIRNVLFNKLSKYKKVDSLGKYLNNSNNISNIKDRFLSDKDGRQLFLDDCVNIYSKYKFVLCIENQYNENDREHYITEKIINAMLANAIPIYIGCKQIHKHFNVNSFVNIDSFDTIDNALKYVIKLDKNINLYKEKLLEPWLINNKLNEYLEWHMDIKNHPMTNILKKFMFN